jgi:hypothetical protein
LFQKATKFKKRALVEKDVLAVGEKEKEKITFPVSIEPAIFQRFYVIFHFDFAVRICSDCVWGKFQT